MTLFGSTSCVTYYKRYRMEMALVGELPMPVLPPAHFLVSWHESLLDSHSEALYQSFRGELDSCVFPSLGCPEGCRQLMAEIRGKSGFLGEATWLLTGPEGYCGTVQGVREASGVGTIQNLGIVRGCRRLGLGLALLLAALHGFQRAGLGKAALEVTAENAGAVRLYQRVGFFRRKTLYKAVSKIQADALVLEPEFVL